MKKIKIQKGNFYSYIPTGKKEYKKFMKVILKHADSVCFTVKPFLDDIEEFNHSIWFPLRESVLDYGYGAAASDWHDQKSSLILLKTDYFLYDFMQNRNHIFDFEEEDPDAGITIEDPAFIKNDMVFCYTVTHEKICDVIEEIYVMV